MVINIEEKKNINRRRNRQLIIRLTEKELSEFSAKMKKSEFNNRADFIMALVREKPTIVPDGFREIAIELKREGNNFNQYLRLMQKNGSEPSWKISVTADKIFALYDRLEKLLDDLKAG